jgi:hypothetical protein
LNSLDHEESIEDLENFFLLNGSTDVWFNLVDPVRDQNPDSDAHKVAVVRKPETV